MKSAPYIIEGPVKIGEHGGKTVVAARVRLDYNREKELVVNPNFEPMQGDPSKG